MDKKYKVKQPGKSSLEIVNPDFKKDMVSIWTELDGEDPQVVMIERKNIDKVIEILKKCKA